MVQEFLWSNHLKVDFQGLGAVSSHLTSPHLLHHRGYANSQSLPAPIDLLILVNLIGLKCYLIVALIFLFLDY